MATFKGLIRQCEVCTALYKSPQSQAHVRTCSRACGYQIRKVANKKNKIELKCAHCADSFFAFPSHEDRRKFCSETCREASPAIKDLRRTVNAGARNPNWKGGVCVPTTSATGKTYRRQPPHIENEKIVRRKRVRAQATPAWADMDLVQDLYALAQAMTEGSGVQYHVDHQVPLTSKKVSGLHNEFNLRPVPAVDNLKKHNFAWPQMW